MESKKGPLQGLRVIDFGQYLPGPLAAMILGDYGADVIHVDPPGGPVWKNNEANAVLMRGKRNIILDLKSPSDNGIAKKLISSADIVIENFRPGVFDRLGLGKERSCAENPALIYCSIPGFSSHDERSAIRGWEGIVSAEAGIYTNPLTSEIRFNALPIASIFAAVIACHSIVSALIVRHKCGRGQFIESAMYDACFEAQGIRGTSPSNFTPTKPVGNRAESNTRLLLRMTKFPCKDGRYIHTTPPPRGAGNMVDALMPEAWNREKELSEQHRHELAELMRQHTALEWEKIGQEKYKAGVVKVQTSAEWLKDDSAIKSRCVIPVSDPILGDTFQPGVPSIILSSGDCAGSRARALPDSDRKSILSELDNIAPPSFASAGAAEPALKGMKVLDFCQVLAGPICGRILAEYGAEVLKINNPRTYENPVAMVGHEAVNNGKLSTYLDLKSEEGRRILKALIKECDIFHCNFSQQAYMNLGVAENQLRECNPEIILSQVNVHSLGGWREWERGHEDLGEAVSGICTRYSGNLTAEVLPILVCDNLTGHNSALGVLLAVYNKLITGKGQRVQACLSRSATLAQIPYMIGYTGKIWDEPSGPQALGWSAFNRIYKTCDGAVFLASAQPDKLSAIQELSNIDFSSADFETALASAIASRTSVFWQKELSEKGAECRILRDFSAEAMDEPYALARGLSVTMEHPGLGTFRTVSCAPRLSLTPPIPGFPVCQPGGDTERFLTDFNSEHPEQLKAPEASLA